MHSHHATTSTRRIPRLAVAALALAAAAGLSSAAPAGAQDVPEGSICHRTNSNANPYLLVTPNQQGQNGANDHLEEHAGPLWNPTLKQAKTEWGDVVPPTAENPLGSQAYQELGADGDAFIARGCRAATPVQLSSFGVVLDKVTTGGTAPAASTLFGFTVICESGAPTTLTAVQVAPAADPVEIASAVTEDDQCTVTETASNGATSTTFQVTGATPDSITTTANSVTFGVGSTVSVVATNAYPDPQAAVVPPPAEVQGVVVTPAAAPAPAPAPAPAAALATTGSPAGYWYVLAGFAFLLGGFTLYGSTARRLLHINR